MWVPTLKEKYAAAAAKSLQSCPTLGDPGIFSLKSVDYMLLLHHAACNTYREVLSLGHFFLFKLTQGAEESLVGIVSNGTGVEEDQISVLSLFGRNESFLYKHTCHDLRVMLVHLASESLYKKCLTHASLSCP